MVSYASIICELEYKPMLTATLFYSIIHANSFPCDRTIFLNVYTDEIVAWLRTVSLAHRVECQVVDTAYLLFVPLMHVATEDNCGIPLGKLVQQEESLFSGEGGGKLQRRRTEDICVTKNESVASINSILFEPLVLQHAFFYKVYLFLPKRAIGRVEEDEMVIIGIMALRCNMDIETIE